MLNVNVNVFRQRRLESGPRRVLTLGDVFIAHHEQEAEGGREGWERSSIEAMEW
jgi:hypothetical protein